MAPMKMEHQNKKAYAQSDKEEVLHKNELEAEEEIASKCRVASVIARPLKMALGSNGARLSYHCARLVDHTGIFLTYKEIPTNISFRDRIWFVQNARSAVS
jgi:hypothetical protein